LGEGQLSDSLKCRRRRRWCVGMGVPAVAAVPGTSLKGRTSSPFSAGKDGSEWAARSSAFNALREGNGWSSDQRGGRLHLMNRTFR
jgi:hypothetical protein